MKKKTTYQAKQQFGLCIDWETSGATWGGDSSIKYQGIAFGAIIFNTDTFEAIEKLKVYVKFDASKYEWSMEAQAIHGITREYLEQHGVTQEDAAVLLIELLAKYFGPDAKVMLLGHNAEFDRRFTNQLVQVVEFEFSTERLKPDFSWIQLHHVVLDTSSTGFIAFGLYKSDLLFEKVGFEDRGDHDPLQDAEQTLYAAKVIRELVTAALEGLV